MNLIEELGLEKARAIVDAVPNGGTHFKLSFGLSIFYLLSSGDGADLAGLWIDDGDDSYWGLSSYKNFELFMPENRFISIEDLRTAIANHDLTVSNSSQNDKQIDLSIKKDIEDHCTDIGYHLSPLTEVTER